MLIKVLELLTLAVIRTAEGNQNAWDAPLMSVTTTEGEGLSLHCRNPPYTNVLPYWYKYVNTLQQIQRTKRVMQDREGTLHFAYVKGSDTGLYKCGTQNKNTIRLGSPVNITVVQRRGGGNHSAPPTLVSYSETTTALLGEDVRLECIFTGRPIPVVTWQRHGRVLTHHTNRSKMISTAFMTVENVTTEDFGEYNCTGENEEGSHSALLYISNKSTKAEGVPMYVVVPLCVAVIVIGGMVFLLHVARTRRRKQEKTEIRDYEEIDEMEVRYLKPPIVSDCE
ncbi:contactin-4-like isoform X2 [Haliotis rufescens]|uniref:contactin-4-like isoform X2 n=1 Tax=Haliotis rufescens TaxID=6454 RepID=UPI00201F74D6|nr:contactin-4-like isoform X2 [Haliotis rufescens]